MVRYRRLVLLLALLVASGVFFHKPLGVTYFAAFEDAQTLDYYSPKDQINLYQKMSKKKWRMIQRLYMRNLAGKQRRHKKERIPKIIHQIWLEETIPENIKTIQATWQKQNPNWEYHLWTKEEIKFLYLQNRVLYDLLNSTKAKMEVLRFEILYQFGGVVIDNDFTCLKPLDILHENCDFYAGLTDQIRTPHLSNACIAATPRHPIIRRSIRKLHNIPPEMLITGPSKNYLTESFFEITKKNGKQTNLALPASFFYSLPKSLEETPHHTHSFAIRKMD